MKRTAKQRPAVAVLVDTPANIAAANAQYGCDTKKYQMGECSVIVGYEPMGFQTSQLSIPTSAKRWHLSIAHPSRYPTWDEMAEAREQLLPRALAFALMFPANWDYYVNVHPNCFHLWEIHDREG